MKHLHYLWAVCAASFIGSTSTSLSAQEAESAPLVLQGTTPWNVDYANDSCALIRGFGEDGERVLLELRQYSPGNALRLVISSSQFEFTRETPTITIAPGEAEELQLAQRLNVEEMSGFTAPFTLLSQGRDPDIDDDQFEQIRTDREEEIYGIQIAGAVDRPLFLETGPMHGAMDALRTCVDDLVASWGVDVDALNMNSQAPIPLDRERWVRQVINHYPRNALRQRREATVRTTLLIGPDGRVARCAVTNALTLEDFAAVACAALITYGRFQPALDAEGEPTDGFFNQNVIYFLR